MITLTKMIEKIQSGEINPRKYVGFFPEGNEFRVRLVGELSGLYDAREQELGLSRLIDGWSRFIADLRWQLRQESKKTGKAFDYDGTKANEDGDPVKDHNQLGDVYFAVLKTFSKFLFLGLDVIHGDFSERCEALFSDENRPVLYRRLGEILLAGDEVEAKCAEKILDTLFFSENEKGKTRVRKVQMIESRLGMDVKRLSERGRMVSHLWSDELTDVLENDASIESLAALQEKMEPPSAHLDYIKIHEEYAASKREVSHYLHYINELYRLHQERSDVPEIACNAFLDFLVGINELLLNCKVICDNGIWKAQTLRIKETPQTFEQFIDKFSEKLSNGLRECRDVVPYESACDFVMARLAHRAKRILTDLGLQQQLKPVFGM